MKALTLVLFLGLLLAAACAAPVPTPIPTQTPIPTATPDIPATVTARVAAIPTATPYPTLTPWPTATPRPTLTPWPTPTAVPTATPYPTSTPYPTPTALPTYTPYPTPTPDIRYEVVTPTPEPTRGPLAHWQELMPRPYYQVSLPTEFYLDADTPAVDGKWGGVIYTRDSQWSVVVKIYSLPIAEQLGDLFSTAGSLRDAYTTAWGYAVDVVQWQEISPTELRASYRLTNGGYCDMRVYARFVQGNEHTHRITVRICSALIHYDEEFADRVLNSFTYPGKQ